MTPADAGIELWLIDLAGCAPTLHALERHTPRLASDDRERVSAIRDPVERHQRLAAHTALRILLERAAGIGVRCRPLLRSPGDRPSLPGTEVQFSLSHTEGFALIGIAPRVSIGVDVERTRPLRMPPRRRGQFLAVGAGFGCGPVPDRGGDWAIIQAWVRLEAFTKARGLALAQTLADLGMRGRGREPVPPANLEAGARQLARVAGLTVCDLELPPGLQAAAAVPVGARLSRPRLFPSDRVGLELLALSTGRSRDA